MCFWVYENNAVYIRFKDKDINPNNEDLRWSGLYRGASVYGTPPSQGISLKILDKSYNSFKNLKIQTSSHPVWIEGDGSHHNVIDNCYIQNGTERVRIGDGAAYNTVSNSTITMNFSGLVQPGAYYCSEPRKQFIYYHYKYNVSERRTSEDHNVLIYSAGEGNEITGNHIYGGLTAIWFGSTKQAQNQQK